MRWVFGLLLGALFIGGGVYIAWQGAYQEANAPGAAQSRDMSSQGGVSIGGPFKLSDHTGKTRTDRDFRGKVMVVYFGYSYCPDVCPTGLYNLQQALKALGPDRHKCQIIFITIDPERDTVDNLALYMDNFGEGFLALTGERSQLEPVYKSFHVYAQMSSDSRGSNDYLMDHSSIVYVMDRDGRYRTSFNHQTDPQQMAAIIRAVID